jgi:prepilin-type N-terminal cleavage/methylation domain-containing protein
MQHSLNRGFALIEVTVAIFVVGLMIVASASLLRGVPATRLTLDQSIALSIAQNKIEALRAGGYAALPATGSFTDSALTALASSTGSVTVTAYASTTKQVQVSVSWREKDTSVRSVSLTTLITNVGGL